MHKRVEHRDFCMHSRRSVNKISVLCRDNKCSMPSSIVIFLSTVVTCRGRKALPQSKLLGVGQGGKQEDWPTYKQQDAYLGSAEIVIRDP